MRPLTAIALLLFLSARGQANVLIGINTPPVVHIFTIDREYPEWEFWLVAQGHERKLVERLPLTASNPVRLPSEGLSKPYQYAAIYAVPKRLLTTFAEQAPPRDWFDTQQANGVTKLGIIHEFGFTSFADSREQIEITYRIELEGNSGRLVKVSENARDPVYYWTRLAPCILVPAAIMLFALWRVKRLLWRRRVATSDTDDSSARRAGTA